MGNDLVLAPDDPGKVADTQLPALIQGHRNAEAAGIRECFGPQGTGLKDFQLWQRTPEAFRFWKVQAEQFAGFFG